MFCYVTVGRLFAWSTVIRLLPQCRSACPCVKLQNMDDVGTPPVRLLKHLFLVFRKKDLYLVITRKLIFLIFMKSGRFHVKFGGFHEIWQITREIWWISCESRDIAFPLHSIKLKSFCWVIWFIRFLGGFHEICQISWNPADFERPIARNSNAYVFRFVAEKWKLAPLCGKFWLYHWLILKFIESQFDVGLQITCFIILKWCNLLSELELHSNKCRMSQNVAGL